MKNLNRERCEVCNHYCYGDTGYWCDATGDWVDDPTRGCGLFDGDTVEVKHLKAELSRTSDKIDILKEYSANPKNFHQLSDREWSLLREQIELLCKYRFIIRQRLNIAKSEDIYEVRKRDDRNRRKGGGRIFEKADQADHDQDGRTEVPGTGAGGSIERSIII